MLTFQQICAIISLLKFQQGGLTMEERFETFTVLINRISRRIRKIKNQEMEEYGLRSPQISCLYYLYVTEGLTATDLCERCEEDKATISRALETLETNGYLTCKSLHPKRYKTPLLLTPKGREAGEKIAHKISRVLDRVSGSLTEEERISFYQSLFKISESLDKLAEKQKGHNETEDA